MKLILTILTALPLAPLAALHGADCYVATNGNDTAAGSRENPFASLRKAADTMCPGDTCWISGGTYRETVSLKGSGKNNLTFQALPGEVVILSGTDRIGGDWRKYKDNIYQTDVAKPVSQVFVDGAPMTYARWPNATFKDRWSPSFWKTNHSPYGRVTDQDIAKSGIDWTGAILTVNTRPTWNKYTAIVKQHGAENATLLYEHDKLWAFSGGKHEGYFLCAKLEALDAPEEWFYDPDAKMFYLCFPGGAGPAGQAVEVKVRDYGFMADQCDRVTLKDLHFFATTFLFRECNGIMVDGCHVRFPNVAYRLTELDRDSKPTVSTTLIGHHNTVRNSSVGYSPTHGLRMLGSYSLVENNLIYDCNQIGSLSYAPLWMGNLEDNVTWESALKYEGRLKETVQGSVAGSTEEVRAKTGDDPDRAKPVGKCVVRNNTLFKSGNIVLGFFEQPDYTVTYNHVYDGGYFVEDVSLIYTTLPQIRGSVIAYNWVHGCPKLAIRGDDQSRGITYHHNVTWDGKVGHIIVKGEDNAMYNNTTLTGTGKNRGLNIQTWPEPNKPWYRKLWPILDKQNTKTPIANNLACTIMDFRSATQHNVPFPPTDPRMANNRVTRDIKPLLRDPDNYDFRPNEESPLVDAGEIIPGITDGFVGKAPDIGAYECGGPLWKPGHQNSLRVSDPDAAGTFQVALSMPPVGQVTVSVAAENGTELPVRIVFNDANWMIPQKVTTSGEGLFRITAKGGEIKSIPSKTVQFPLPAGAHAEPAASPKKPNIIFVLFDDMGYGQPQCYNAQSALRTPNFDKLATQGMRFTDAHTAAAVCTPTRYGVITGRYPSRIGQFGVLKTFEKPIIPESRTTVASLLKTQGYTTACIGKWHLGMKWVDGKQGTEKVVPVGAKMTGGPNALGFDYFYGYTHAQNLGSIIEQDRVVTNVKPVENQPLMLKKAVEWIDQRKAGEPFFLYYPLGIPHMPVVPSEEFAGNSGAKDLVKRDPEYGDWLFQGDAMLGNILEALERNKLADNTLIIVTSDNGAEHRAYAPLRESKRSIYEGGHRVPFVVRWPGKVKPGSVNDHTVCLNDLMATAAEIVGAKLPDNSGEDSVSLMPELLGTTASGAREATIHQSAAGDLAIRQGPWKLIFLKSGKHELYNLQTDLSETKDVLAANPEVVAKLTALMQRYINDGRSTPGVAQKNDFDLSLTGGKAKGKRSNKGQKTAAESAREMALAADPAFDSALTTN